MGFVNQASFTPLFDAEASDLFTPQISLGRANIPLSTGKENICDGPTGKAKDKVFCYFADVSVNAGQTYSDQPTLQNANAAVSAKLNKNFDRLSFSLGWQATATGRVYEEVKGGRRDLQLQTGPHARLRPYRPKRLH